MKSRVVISQVFNSIKILVSYVLCVLVVLLYTYFVDGTSGVLLMAFMVLVPIVSLVAMLVAKSTITLELACPYPDCKKHTPIEVVLKLSKGSIVPIPFVNVTLGYTPHMCTNPTYSEEEFPQVRLTMSFEKSTEYVHRLTSSVAGKGTVYVKDAYVYDYLGFFRVKLKDIPNAVDIYVTPEVKDVETSQTLFRSICSSVLSNDEEEENSQSSTLSASTNLGYLHREYVEGDSPRKINWKLSCKRNKLMVRLDEPSPQTKPCIVLDMSVSSVLPNPLKSLQNFEALVESSLALANTCVTNGIECTFTLCNCDHTTEYILTSQDDIHHLAIEISHISANDKHTLPSSMLSLKSSESMYLLFTDSLEGELQSNVSTLRDRGILVEVVLSSRYYGQYTASNVWVVSKDLTVVPSTY